MKTFIKNAGKTLCTTSIFVVSSILANAQSITRITNNQDLNAINRVAVTGNVEVTIVQSGEEGIAYADNNFGKVKVTLLGHLVTISPADQYPAKVILFVKDIFRISAEDNAVVTTQGRLKTAYLQVFLKGDAVANLNTKTIGLYTVLDDKSKLDLMGITEEQSFATSRFSKLNTNHLANLSTTLMGKKNRLSRNQSYALVGE